MKRLTSTTLPEFLTQDRPALILFGSPEGQTTTQQALEFAEAWADHDDDAAFGYIDAFANIAAARAYRVRVLPTTLFIERGEVLRAFEGVHASTHFSAALHASAAPEACAA